MSNGVGSRQGMREAAPGRLDGVRAGWSWWYLLLLIQFIAVLWPPFYNMAEPELIGIPFFYWYQLLWVIIGAILTAIVYFATDD
ncbi:Protein of unknown function [Bradyrhizobium sp. Gha]|nr:Protein of unknown function [Bradyrhizobium sp. Gha]